MSIILNDNIKIQAPKPSDERYLDALSVPFTSINAANTYTTGRRHIGLTVNINGSEYWYANGITNTDLVLKTGRAFTKLIYVDSNDPNTATIFDDENPPIENDDTFKADVNNLYVGIDGITWTYSTSPAGYSPATEESLGGSNFYITGTNTSADNIKTGSITKKGELVIDSGIEEVSGLVLPRIKSISSLVVSQYHHNISPSSYADIVVLPTGDILAVSDTTMFKIPSGGGLAVVYASGLPANGSISIAVLPNGDALVTTQGNGNKLYKVPAGGGVAVAYGSGLTAGRGVTLLSNEDALVANVNVVSKIPSGGGAAVSYSSGFSNPAGMRTLASGEVLVANFGANNIMKIPVGGGTPSIYASGIPSPYDLVVLDNGDILVSTYSGTIYKVSSGGGVATIYYAVFHASYGIDKLADGSVVVSTVLSGILGISRLSITSPKVLKTDSNGKVVKTIYLEDVQYALATDLIGKEDKFNKGAVNGYTPLDSNGKVPLTYINDALLGNVKYQGLYNATTNTPDLTVVQPKGYYYVCSNTAQAVRFGLTLNTGDWIISNGTAWEKVDNTDAVSTVFGRTGNITAQAGDYTTALVTEVTNKNYQTDLQKLYNDATSSIQTQLNSKLSGTGVNGQVSFWTGAGTQAGDNNLFWDNTNKRLGIGTTNPTLGKLQIKATSYQLVLQGDTSTTESQVMAFYNSSGVRRAYFGFGSPATHVLNLTNDQVDGHISLNTSGAGNVGIGTTLPNSKLDIETEGDTGLGISLYSNTPTSSAGFVSKRYLGTKASPLAVTAGIPLTGFYGAGYNGTAMSLYASAIRQLAEATFTTTSTPTYIDFATTPVGSVNRAERMRINSNGNVGIGTISPISPLTVQTNSSALGISVLNRSTDDFGNIAFYNFDGTTSLGGIGNSNGRIRIMVGGLGDAFERVSVSSGGNVGIGTTSPSTRLHIYNNTDVYSLMIGDNLNSNLKISGTATGATGYSVIQAFTAGTSATGTLVLNRDGGNVGIGITPTQKLHVSGNVLVTGSVTATAFFASSDIRLKDIIKPVYKNPTDIKAISYTWKDGRDNRTHIGYPAQEVQKYIPDAVNEDEDGKLSVNYIDVLVAKVASLEEEVKLLKKR